MAPFRSFVSFSRWVFFFTFWVRSLSLSLSLSLPLLLFWPSNRPYFMRSGGCRHESGTALDAVVVIQSDGVQGNFSCGLFFFYFSGIAPQGEDGEGGGRWKGSGIDIWLKVNYDPPRRISISTWRLKVCFGGEKGNGTWWPGATFFFKRKAFSAIEILGWSSSQKMNRRCYFLMVFFQLASDIDSRYWTK